MTAAVPERRGSARIELLPNEHVLMGVTHRVQLLDISLAGALIACDARLPVGTRARLSMALSGRPLNAELTVTRHHARPLHRRGAGLGAVFSSMDDRSRRHLEQFLLRASGRDNGVTRA